MNNKILSIGLFSLLLIFSLEQMSWAMEKPNELIGNRLFSLINENKEEEFAELLKNKNIDEKWYGNYTPLELTIVLNRPSLVNFLVNNGANTLGIEKYAEMASKKDIELFYLLMTIINKEVIINNADKYIKLAIDSKNIKAFNFILENLNSSGIDHNKIKIHCSHCQVDGGQEIYNYAQMHNENFGQLDWLIKNLHAPYNSPEDKSPSELMLDDLRFNHSEEDFEKHLAEGKIDVNAKCFGGLTLLENAILFERINIINLLINKKVNIDNLIKIIENKMEIVRKKINKKQNEEHQGNYFYQRLMDILSAEIIEKDISRYIKIALDINDQQAFDIISAKNNTDLKKINISERRSDNSMGDFNIGYYVLIHSVDGINRNWIWKRVPEQLEDTINRIEIIASAIPMSNEVAVRDGKTSFYLLLHSLNAEDIKKNISRFMVIALDANDKDAFDLIHIKTKVDLEKLLIKLPGGSTCTIAHYVMHNTPGFLDRDWVWDRLPGQLTQEIFATTKEEIKFTLLPPMTKNVKEKVVPNITTRAPTKKINENWLTENNVATEFISIIAEINELIKSKKSEKTLGEILITIKNEENVVELSSTSSEGGKILDILSSTLKAIPCQFSVEKNGNNLRINIVSKLARDMATLRVNIKSLVSRRINHLMEKLQPTQINPATVTQFPIDVTYSPVSHQVKGGAKQSYHSEPVHSFNVHETKKNKPSRKGTRKNIPNSSKRKNNTKIAPKPIKPAHKALEKIKAPKQHDDDGEHYLLSTPDVNPLDFESQFLDDENVVKNEEKIINDDKNIIYDQANLWTIYKSLLETIYQSKLKSREELLEIISHGVLALNFKNIDDPLYIKTTIINLSSMKQNLCEQNIMLEAHLLFEQFKKEFLKYKSEEFSPSQRIEQLNALLMSIKLQGHELTDNADAIDAVLFMLGEHFVRLKDSKVIFTLAKNFTDLFNSIQEFRNGVKHDKDNRIIQNDITFMKGKNDIGKGFELFTLLMNHLQQQEGPWFLLKK